VHVKICNEKKLHLWNVKKQWKIKGLLGKEKIQLLTVAKSIKRQVYYKVHEKINMFFRFIFLSRVVQG